MKKLTLMRGLPGSGKSTMAEKLMRERGGTIRVNKDLLRTMLHFDKHNGKLEEITGLASEAIAEMAIKNDLNVIIDDTNLNPKVFNKWNAFAAKNYLKVEVIDVDTDILECLRRDAGREKKVGYHVIHKMALQYKDLWKGDRAVICDLDGTLCDLTHRLQYAKGETKNWDTFFSLLHLDTLRTEVLGQVEAELENNPGAHLVLVSARPEDHREATEKWLKENGVRYSTLIMRPSHDKREDQIVKREIYDKYLKNLNIIKVFDDRQRVIRMWRELGLEVVDVGTGEEF